VQKLPIPPRLIIFDFDGVIVESNAIKDRAFYTLYLPYGEDAAQCAHQLHMANPGASRFEKFAIIHKALLGREITPAESHALGLGFASLCFEAVCACPMVPGAEEFLTMYSRRLSLALASATPEEELVAIVEKRGLRRYFRHICGKPRSKVESLNYILTREGLAPAEAVFVGDQPSDRDAAHYARIPFIKRLLPDSSQADDTGASGITNILQLREILAL
jgi:phosphoglycolate phosphatase-like HAD superfamily hydrolase